MIEWPEVMAFVAGLAAVAAALVTFLTTMWDYKATRGQALAEKRAAQLEQQRLAYRTVLEEIERAREVGGQPVQDPEEFIRLRLKAVEQVSASVRDGDDDPAQAPRLPGSGDDTASTG